MPRIPKRLFALGGLMAAGGVAFKRLRGGGSAPAPAATPASGPTPPVAAQPPVTPVATPPIDAPGPSVNAVGGAAAGSETERAEAADAATPDPDVLERQAGGPVDDLVESETAAAAAEAAGIGGDPGEPITDDPALEPVYEAGGGEAEGFEAAESELIENASHGGGAGDPSRDAFTPEVEADEATARNGEADEEKVSEVVEEGDEAGGPGSGSRDR